MKNTKKIISAILATLFLLTTSTASILAEPNMNGNQNNQSHSHGSSEKVTEDMLKTDADIEEGYDVNKLTQAKASSGAYSKLFDTENIQDVKINIDENNWNYMLQNAIDKPNVLADSVSIGDETVKYASIKTKGNLTLNQVWNSDSDRFSFTVNFGKYIKKKNGYSDTQNFYGLNKVALNNIYGDASLMKEYLSYKLMTEMGVDTPYYTLVNLYINDEFYGVYCMIESIDSALTQRTIDEKSDVFVKPEKSGAELTYNSALNKYINGDGDFVFETTDYPTDKSDPLYNYNGLWENDEDTFDDVKDMLPTIFKWLKTLNNLSNTENCNTEEYKNQLESIIDVDKLIRYFAVNTYLVNLDSYQSDIAHNYALYINKTGFAQIFPWDYNFSFGAQNISNASEMVNFSISNPLSKCTLSERPLLNVIFQNKDYKALYEKYLKDCTTIASVGGKTSDNNNYQENNFGNVLDSFNNQLKNIYSNDPTAFYTLAQYNTATSNLKQLISDRSTAVLKQLSGDMTPVETNVNLNAIGNVLSGNNGQKPEDTEVSVLTDSSTGITIKGKFPQDATLVVSLITEGDVFNNTLRTLNTQNLLLYNISINMGNAPEWPDGDINGNPPTNPDSNNQGNMPSQPDGENQGNPPMKPDDDNQNNIPTKPDGDNQENMPVQPDGDNQEFEISFPSSNEFNNTSIYLVNNDGTVANIENTQNGNMYTVKSKQLGTFALTYSISSNNEEGTIKDLANNTDNSGFSAPKTGEKNNNEKWIIALLSSCLLVGIFGGLKIKKNKN